MGGRCSNEGAGHDLTTNRRGEIASALIELLEYAENNLTFQIRHYKKRIRFAEWRT